MKLTAPKDRTGIVMCSASGQNYQIGEHGQVEVSAVDVSDLLRAGFSTGDTPQEPPTAPAATFSQEPAPGIEPTAGAAV
jgi:hypothetical protein